MRSARSLINKRYFYFRAKQFFPYGLIMALVSIATTLVINLSVENFSGYSMNHLVNEAQLIFPSAVFMYIFPILTALFLFSFIHKKNSADLFSAAPVTKTQIYCSNMLIALVYFAVIILATMLVSIITISLFDASGIPLKVAFDSFMNLFVTLLIGFMQVYTITATAATLTGTVPAQLFTAVSMLLVPTALVLLCQFPLLANVSVNFSNYTRELGEASIGIMGKSIDKVIYPLNIATAPLSLLVTNGYISYFDDVYGIITHFTSVPAKLYTIALIVVYAVSGCVILKKYKMENVERPFTKELFGLVMRFAIFFPIIAVSVLAFYNDGYIFNPLFLILFLFITVAYIVADLILRKGIKGMGRSLTAYAIICVVAVLSGFGLGIATELMHVHTPITVYHTEVEQLNIYIKPLNMTPATTENIVKYYKKIEISDPTLISDILGNEKEAIGRGGYYWIEIYKDGKKYFARKSVSLSAMDSLYEYIDNDPELKKSLMVNTGLSNHLKADVVLAQTNSSYRGRNYLTSIDSRKTVKDLRKDYEALLLATPCKDIYENKKDDAFINNYSIGETSTDLGEFNSEMYMVEVKYSNGMYYLSASVIPESSEEFTNSFRASNRNVMKLSVKEEKAFYNPIGSFDLDEKQIFDLKTVLFNMQDLIDKDFRETVINSLDKNIIFENSVVFEVSYGNKRGFFVLNYERDLEPLVEKYADAVCKVIANNTGNVYFDSYQYGDFVHGSVKAEESEKASAELKNNLSKIKADIMQKRTKNEYPLEFFRGSFRYQYKEGSDSYTKNVYFPIDKSYSETLGIYLKEYEKTNRIVEIKAEAYSAEKKHVLTPDDGEAFEILRHSIVMRNIEQNYGIYSFHEDYYYSTTEAYSFSLYSNSIAYDYDVKNHWVMVEVTYADGMTESFELDLTKKAYEKLNGVKMK